MAAKNIVVLRPDDWFNVASELERFAGYCRTVGEQKKSATGELRKTEGFSNFVDGMVKLQRLLAKELGNLNVPATTLAEIRAERVKEAAASYEKLPRSGNAKGSKPEPGQSHHDQASVESPVRRKKAKRLSPKRED